MSGWKEKANQVTRQIAEEAAAEESRKRAQAEAVQAGIRRQLQISEIEKRLFRRKKAETANRAITQLDLLQARKALEGIRTEVWEGRGEVGEAPTVFDGIVVGKTISLTSIIPGRVQTTREDIIAFVPTKTHIAVMGGMGEFSHFKTETTLEKESVGTKITDVRVAPVTTTLRVSYGFGLEEIESDAPLPETSTLAVDFLRSNADGLNYGTSLPLQNPDLSVLTAFMTRSLALTCAAVMRDPFSAQIARTEAEYARAKAEYLKQMRPPVPTAPKPQPGIGSRVRDFLRGE